MNKLKTIWDKTFENHWARLALHIAFWIVYGFFMREDSRQVLISTNEPLWVNITGIWMHLFLFYPLVYLIFPLFQKSQWVKGILLFIPYYVLATWFRTYHMDTLIQWLRAGENIQYDGQHLWKNLVKSNYNPLNGLAAFLSYFTYMMINILVPVWIKILRNAYRFSKKQADLVRQNMQLQISQLRAQINPHFFFNTLNNLQSFVIHGEKEKSIQLISQMADFMRVSLYETGKEWIELDKELAMIQNYIGIEKIRLEEDTDLQISINPSGLSGSIPPLLLLPFVENAFKYSHSLPGYKKNLRILIKSENEQLHFHVSNNYDAALQPQPGGFGLLNVKKRLNYYYPELYELQIAAENNCYSVDLKLPLS